MKRRNFVLSSALAGMSISASPTFGFSLKEKKEDPFNLLFAPHFGMFNNSSGPELKDQLKFMADQGFRALEDNGMKGRPLEDQELIAKRMERYDMQMGVFVAHKIYWNEPNLASGKKEKRELFEYFSLFYGGKRECKTFDVVALGRRR